MLGRKKRKHRGYIVIAMNNWKNEDDGYHLMSTKVFPTMDDALKEFENDLTPQKKYIELRF